MKGCYGLGIESIIPKCGIYYILEQKFPLNKSQPCLYAVCNLVPWGHRENIGHIFKEIHVHIHVGVSQN